MVRETDKDIDFALMRQIQKGDMIAFGTLVDRYKHRLMNVCTRMLSSTEEAEDVVQETFVRVHQHRNLFNYRHCFSTWIYTICLNLARNVLRRRKKYAYVEISELPRHEAKLAVKMKLPSRLPQALETAIRELPENSRDAFLLRDVQELPYEEVGAVLGVPIGTVKSRVSRARSILRAQLRPFLDYTLPWHPGGSVESDLPSMTTMAIRKGH